MRQREQKAAKVVAASVGGPPGSNKSAEEEDNEDGDEDEVSQAVMTEVRTSLIPNSGQGLFLTSRFIKAGTVRRLSSPWRHPLLISFALLC